MTFLSWFALGPLRRRWSVCTLVRSSQLLAPVVAALSVTGCLIEEPPTWDSKPTPPVIGDFTPTTGKILVIDLGQQQRFTFSETSEDQGQALRVVWYLNYGIADQESYLNNKDYPAGDSSQAKNIEIDWAFASIMCVPFTAMMTHAGNVGNDNFHRPIDLSDAAFVTWIVKVKDKSDTNPDISTCPTNLGVAGQ